MQVQIATVRVVVDELERWLVIGDSAAVSCLGEQLAAELELLARALRRRDEAPRTKGNASPVGRDDR
jgi:hypothetical protein